MGRALAALVCILSIAAGCTAAASPAPPTGDPDSSTPPAPSAAPSASPTGAPSQSHAAAAPAPTPTPASSTPAGPGASAAVLPIRGDAGNTGRPTLMAPTGDGSLYVAIQGSDGAVLLLLDRDGDPMPGWPIAVPQATRCDFLGVAEDGSVRAICDGGIVRAFAFDRAAQPLPGWPVEIGEYVEARMVGTDLVVLTYVSVTDIVSWGARVYSAHLSRISSDGSLEGGAAVPILYRGGHEDWAIGPDGIAYGTSYIAASEDASDPPWVRCEILAVGLEGIVGGWPVAIEGIASAPGFDADGRILVNVGTWDEPPTRVFAIEPGGRGTTISSDALPLTGPASGLQCGRGEEVAPLAADGMTVTSDAGVSPGGRPTWYALDRSLETLPGWPHQPAWYVQTIGYPHPGDVDCVMGPPVDAVLASDGTLYVALAAASETTGGSLAAIGRNGRSVDGWPVELRAAEAGFWSVVVGSDGTVFALAVEREARGASATVLAIEPDSNVRWRTTVLEP